MTKVDASLFSGVWGADPNLQRPGPSVFLSDSQREPGFQLVPKLGTPGLWRPHSGDALVGEGDDGHGGDFHLGAHRVTENAC